MIPSTEWHERARCLTMDPTMFETGHVRESIKPLEACNGAEFTTPCPVREECLLAAFREEQDWNRCYLIRGGMTGPQRDKLTRKERNALINDLTRTIKEKKS